MAMKKIPEIETVSLDMFREEIVPAGKAVVMRGAVDHWASVGKAGETDALCDYLRAGSTSGDVSVMRAKPSVGGRFFTPTICGSLILIRRE